MDVPSYAFLGFAALVALLINISGAPAWRRPVLSLANIAFVLSFTHTLIELAPFAGLLAFGYASVKVLETRKNKFLFTALLAITLFTFCWLKHYTFIPQTLSLRFMYMTVGMSYVFFRVMHLIVDAYQDSLPCRVELLSYISYTLNFTSLVSGPIQTYPAYLRTETEKPLPLDENAVGQALQRIVLGFFKVSVVSPIFAYAHDRSMVALVSGLPFAERACDFALVIAIFPVYLYVNFSGYTDFVIGVARFLRLDLPENFNNPFAAKGFIDFWGRWHISLSTWFKTYVYSPLLMGLIRRFPEPNAQPLLGVLAYFVTFFLVGVWHGQTSMFLFYGVLQGLGVSVNKLYQIEMTRRLGRARYRELCAGSLYGSFSRALTSAWFAFTLLWFWSSWAQLSGFVTMLGFPAIMLSCALMICAAAPLLSAAEALRKRWSALHEAGSSVFASRYARTAWCAVLLGITLSVTAVLNAPAPHIVYKAF